MLLRGGDGLDWRLSVDRLEVRFGGVVALRDVSFHVSADECLGLIGPNGSGKTTLFNAVTGFVRPTGGRVSWRGRDCTGVSPQAMARSGIVRSFQQPMVFPSLSVAECLLTIATRETVRGLLRLGNLERFAEANASTLPYGLMRRLGVLLALAMSPTVLMLDEPTSGLSAPEVKSMADLLGAVRAREIGLWVIDHNIAFLERLCDRLIVLNSGSLLTEGSPKKVLSDSAVRVVYLEGETSET
jgi:branched-chain amino acid transport system ATP-binding protein